MIANQDNFWQFSVQLYSEPGVADSCLKLQNEHGLDVNLVLFCIWYGFSRGRIDPDQLHHGLQFSADWRQSVVQPLRDTRTHIKQQVELQERTSAAEINVLRERIKSLELQAERIQQQELEHQARQLEFESGTGHPSAEAAMENLKLLLKMQEVELSDDIEVLQKTILRRVTGLAEN